MIISVCTHTCWSKSGVTTRPCFIAVKWSELCVTCIQFFLVPEVKHETSWNRMPWWKVWWMFSFPFLVCWKWLTSITFMGGFKLLKLRFSLPELIVKLHCYECICFSYAYPRGDHANNHIHQLLGNPVLCHRQNGTAVFVWCICSKTFGWYPTVSCPLLHLYNCPATKMVPAIPWILRGYERSFDPSLQPYGWRSWPSPRDGQDNPFASWLWNCSNGDQIITGGIRNNKGSKKESLSNVMCWSAHGWTWLPLSNVLQIVDMHCDQQGG